MMMIYTPLSSPPTINHNLTLTLLRKPTTCDHWCLLPVLANAPVVQSLLITPLPAVGGAQTLAAYPGAVVATPTLTNVTPTPAPTNTPPPQVD